MQKHAKIGRCIQRLKKKNLIGINVFDLYEEHYLIWKTCSVNIHSYWHVYKIYLDAVIRLNDATVQG